MTEPSDPDRIYSALPPTAVFDETAQRFASVADGELEQGRYHRGELFLRSAREWVSANGRILDYGCGPGRISMMLARSGFSVLGMDPSAAMICAAQSQSIEGLRLAFEVSSGVPAVESAPPFDAVVCSSVIEYVADPGSLLRSFSAILGNSGVLMISFANRVSLWRKWCRFRNPSPYMSAQQQTWSWREFRTLLSRCGFAPAARPVYFDSPLDGNRFSNFSLIGTLGLVVARKCWPGEPASDR